MSVTGEDPGEPDSLVVGFFGAAIGGGGGV